MNRQVIKSVDNLKRFGEQVAKAVKKGSSITSDLQREIDRSNYIKSISSEKCIEMAEELALKTSYSLADLLSLGEDVVEFMKNQLHRGEIVNHRDYKHSTLSEIMGI